MDIRQRLATYLSSPNTDLLSSDREELSYSRMSTMIRNPREHYLKYEKHLRYYKEKSALFFGKVMHEVLAYFYNTEMEAPLHDLHEYLTQQFNGYLANTNFPIEYSQTELLNGIPRKEQEESKKLLESNPSFKQAREAMACATLLELGKQMLTIWYDTYAEDDKKNTQTLETEVPFWIPLVSNSGRISQKYMISGIIDRIYKDSEGKIFVQDHKNLGRKMAETTPDSANQISVYYLGAVSLGYMLDGATYNILYKTKTPTVERLFTKRTNDQLVDFMQDANDIAKCISYGIKFKNYQMGEFGDFTEYLLRGDKDTVVEYDRVPLKERIHGDLNSKNKTDAKIVQAKS